MGTSEPFLQYPYDDWGEAARFYEWGRTNDALVIRLQDRSIAYLKGDKVVRLRAS